MSVLSPALVAAIDDLELAARLMVEGLRAGSYRSPFRGAGAEFQQHRLYRAGDDLKHLDWKLYARSNRLYTRQYRETTNLSALLVLDTSASMGFVGANTSVSKLRYATVIAAALAYLLVDNGNAIGLLTGVRGAWQYLPPRSGQRHLKSVLVALDQLRAVGVWEPASSLARCGELLRRRSMVLCLTDGYDNEEGLHAELRHLVQHGHDVSLLQLLSTSERQLSFTAPVVLRDAEGDTRHLLDPSTARALYAANLRAFVDRHRDAARGSGIDYALFDTGDAPERTLRAFLVGRSARQHDVGEPVAQHAALRVG
jgi:uncharacterized protein (DUF58 family)